MSVTTALKRIMVPFLFRPHRIKFHLSMRVGLQDMHTGIPLPGLITTTVINFSEQGACLVLPKLTISGKHIFYETLNSDNYNLLLRHGELNGVDDESTIAARSLWMDSCDHMGKSAFKIGIHFLQNQKELYKFLKKCPPS